jgi:hypothetical protein
MMVGSFMPLPAAGGGGIIFNDIASNSTPAHPLSITVIADLHDVLVAGMVTDSTEAGQDPFAISGFTQKAFHIMTYDSGAHGALLKADSSGSEGALDVTNGNSNTMIGFILSLTGANNATPEDVATQSTVTASGMASPWTKLTSITPVTNGCMIVAVMSSDDASGGTITYNFETTTGTTGPWTVRGEFRSGAHSIAVGTAIQATAGAITVTGTGTLGGATAARSLTLFAIRPA